MIKNLIRISILAMLFLCFAMGTVEGKSKDPEPNGFQAGGFVIHPGVDLGIAYDTRDGQGEDDALADMGVHLKTHLLDEKRYSWNNLLSFRWRQFWGLGKADVEGGPVVNVSSDADLLKDSVFRINPKVSYIYSNEPEDEYLRRDFEQHHVRGGVAFYIQPSGGAVFSQRLGYQLDGRFYSERSDVSHLVHRVDSVTRWNFLPQTSMALNVDFRYISYLEDERIVARDIQDNEKQNSSSMPVRLKYSLQGLLLERLSYQLGLGYAYEHYDNGLSEHMFVMNAKIRYDFTESTGLFVQYSKDFDNVIYGDYYKLHDVRLGFDALWFDHLQTDFLLGFGAFDFISVSNAQRTDYLFSGSADIYYHFFPGMKLGLEYRIRYNNSNVDGGSYIKNMISLNFSYEY